MVFSIAVVIAGVTVIVIAITTVFLVASVLEILEVAGPVEARAREAQLCLLT